MNGEVAARLRVVCADDDADILGLVSIAVDRAGLEVVGTAGDGDSALDAIRRLTPELAILDVAMPGRSGLEVCRAVRADPALAGVTLVVLSASVHESDRKVALEAGADHFLTKPFSPRELAGRLAELAR